MQEYKGRIGFKKQCNEDWPRVQKDYFIMEKFLQSNKANDSKNQKFTDMVRERSNWIEIYSKTKGLRLNQDGDVHREDKKKSLAERSSFNKNEHKFDGKSASQF